MITRRKTGARLGENQEDVLTALYPSLRLTQAQIAKLTKIDPRRVPVPLKQLEEAEYIERDRKGRGGVYWLTYLGTAYVVQHELVSTTTLNEPRPKGDTSPSDLTEHTHEKQSPAPTLRASRNEDENAAGTESLDLSRFKEERHLDEAVGAASELDAGERFRKRLCDELKIDPSLEAEAFIAQCRKAARQKVVRAVGLALQELTPERQARSRMDGRLSAEAAGCTRCRICGAQDQKRVHGL